MVKFAWSTEKNSFIEPDIASAVHLAPVSAGYYHSCGVPMDHSLWCWGSNGSGQVGAGDKLNQANQVKISP